jgi:lipid-A-disaccharide synthase-like uncharacterized protein
MTDPTMTEEYRNADNGSASLIGVSFALLALTTIFVVLLLVSRYYKETSVPPLMFWLILLAYVFNTGNAIDNACTFTNTADIPKCCKMLTKDSKCNSR